MPTASDITLHDPDGVPVELTSLAADPLVVVLVRYYGCLPCQAYLRDVDAARDRFADGARVIAVGGSADFQARWLRDDMGIGLPLLLDPDQHVRALRDLGLERREGLQTRNDPAGPQIGEEAEAGAQLEQPRLGPLRRLVPARPADRAGPRRWLLRPLPRHADGRNVRGVTPTGRSLVLDLLSTLRRGTMPVGALVVILDN